jgi:2,4-dichlorophenol 6-monooxygenase
MHATRYRSGRVFCVGDAVHRHPPNNGLGSNTSIQDSYNLAWKLALVLEGKAGAGLLDSFELERVPIGEQIVSRANKSIDQFAPIFDALGLLEPGTPAELVQRMRARADNTPEAEKQRAALREGVARKNYEFSAHGVEMNQRYHSGAIVSDGTDQTAPDRDVELYHQATTWPGARLPHCWVGRNGRRVSTLDLVGNGGFSLLTGISGRPWVTAAQTTRDKLGVPIAAHVIGPGCEYIDLYDDWARIREVGEAGCVLVRPDGFVCWRSADLSDSPDQVLTSVLATILDSPLIDARQASVEFQ